MTKLILWWILGQQTEHWFVTCVSKRTESAYLNLNLKSSRGKGFTFFCQLEQKQNQNEACKSFCGCLWETIISVTLKSERGKVSVSLITNNIIKLYLCTICRPITLRKQMQSSYFPGFIIGTVSSEGKSNQIINIYLYSGCSNIHTTVGSSDWATRGSPRSNSLFTKPCPGSPKAGSDFSHGGQNKITLGAKRSTSEQLVLS